MNGCSGLRKKLCFGHMLHFCVYYNNLLSMFLIFHRVLTPYYQEDVLFSIFGLEKQNEDGVSILFYLQKIFPGLFPFVLVTL